MYITLILFWIGILGFLLDRKNIISHTRKFLLLVSYNNVDLIGPAFKSIKEGLQTSKDSSSTATLNLKEGGSFLNNQFNVAYLVTSQQKEI